ncbi:CHAT domain-containing protein [Candidatus Parabeggiatoa sp. HSG14]|uniref:CHAT domain-containing protein n=1 Tax=Candidatus Parabeggiatoa sp. HSG14 TaxID=3055593 RepID=UPI0025A85169|nr:CHAT domain-containing protein [Thiotrichales bacterium HSG14]
MNRFYSFLFVFLWLLNFSNPQAQPLLEARQAFQSGHYAQAISQWKKVLATTQNTNHRLEAWFGMARSYRWLGNYKHTFKILETALPVAKKNLTYHAILLNELSKLRLTQGNKWYEEALEIGEQAMSIARKTNNPLLLAEILKHWGNLLTTDYNYEEAIEVYREALAYSSETIAPMAPFSEAEMATLSGKILISQAQAIFFSEKYESHQDKKFAFKETIGTLEQAIVATKNWHSTYDQAFALFSLTQLVQKIQVQLTQPSAQLTNIANQALRKSLKIAERLDNTVAKSYANGYLGQLYEQAKRYEEALFLTRQALFFAQPNQSKRLLYLWQWQLGRIKKNMGDNEGAIKNYQQAIKYLAPIRSQAMTGYFNFMTNFREQVAPVYFELADLLLQQIETHGLQQVETHGRASLLSRDKLLHHAIEVIEDFKEAELQNYFQSDCIDIKTECADLKRILDTKTAILYPIMLPERLELLLYRDDGLVQVTLPIGEKTLHKKIVSFLSRLRHHPNPEELARNRSMLAADGKESNKEVCTPSLRGSNPQKITRASQTFLKPSQTLYNWLIKPLVPHLQGIETLVIVPDGALRTIPFAALHDGQQFLIQNYALAVSPSLCFNESHILQSRENRENKVLLNGLSESVQGFSSLPCAKYEIEVIQTLYSQLQTTLLNKTFTTSNVHHKVKQVPYSILHIASHGQFKGNLEDTFILTYDSKLNMDQLEGLISNMTVQDKTVDLLALSACETAVGDDRAALGLAGVALKAGVKSAFASLWKIDDEATPAVVIEFYRQLQNHKVSKAKALQYAQKLMLTHDSYVRYRHPYYWSAFLLIGDWF